MLSGCAYHSGADVSMLSQFGAEQEVLFLPNSQFRVVGRFKAVFRSFFSYC
mgnify:CR=1 FL=1